MDFEAMAIECSRLMDEIEVINAGGTMSSEDENADERMKKISDYATLLSSFRPDLLDPRFGQLLTGLSPVDNFLPNKFRYQTVTKQTCIMSVGLAILVLSTPIGDPMCDCEDLSLIHI